MEKNRVDVGTPPIHELEKLAILERTIQLIRGYSVSATGGRGKTEDLTAASGRALDQLYQRMGGWIE